MFLSGIFFAEEGNLVYCKDVKGLIAEFNTIDYNSSEWRLFIDSSTRSLKAVLLHNGNIYAPLPLAHSVILDEDYKNCEFLLTKLQYDEHNWQLCGDLKILTIILGQQTGFTKYPCFLCEWDSRSRDEHYVKKVWPARKNFIPGKLNIVNNNLVPIKKVLLPPLHIKLGLMKQFVVAMRKDNSEAFKYIFKKLPKLSEAKIKAGVFNGPQIRTLLKDKEFEKKNEFKRKKCLDQF